MIKLNDREYKPKLRVNESGTDIVTITVSDMDGLTEIQLQQLFLKVFKAVNRAAELNKNNPNYNSLFNEGPLLYRTAVMYADGGQGEGPIGIQVAQKNLKATLGFMEKIGFIFQEN